MKKAILIAFVVISGHALANEQCSTKYVNEKLYAIAMNPFVGEVYVNDGAGDGTILQYNDKNIDELLACGEPVMSVLIDNISNPKKSNVCFRGGYPSEVRVPATVGFVALDILFQITGNNKTVGFPDCSDDGMGACYQPDFYFLPDQFLDKKSGVVTSKVIQVQNAWRRAYTNQKIHFVNPDWYFQSTDNYDNSTEDEPKYNVGYINDPDGYTNVRSEPAATSEIMRVIKSGEKFRYIPSACSSWWTVINNDGTYGYIHKSRITPSRASN